MHTSSIFRMSMIRRVKFHSFTAVLIFLCVILEATSFAQDAHFHNAPASSTELKNPLAGQAAAIKSGKWLYAENCGACHGVGGRGTGNVPPLNQGATQKAPDGEVFWFITTGSPDKGMPAWERLPEQVRWEIVSYVRTFNSSPNGRQAAAAPAAPVKTDAPAPPAP